MPFSIIVAHDKNRGIGKDNKIPWYLSKDFKWFKLHTINKTVIMGMNTYFSLPKKFRPLPKRNNIVLCDDIEKSEIIRKEGAIVYNSIDDVFNNYKNHNVFIMGGASIYNQFIDKSDFLYITLIDSVFDCDTYFPEYDINKYTVVFESDNMIDNDINYKFIVYEKK